LTIKTRDGYRRPAPHCRQQISVQALHLQRAALRTWRLLIAQNMTGFRKS
jgi:hypothetical protein